MNNSLALLQALLKKNKYLLAAFIIPLLVRSIPVILSWPYPIGFDTIGYIPLIQKGWVFSLGPIGFLKTTGMFYAVAALPYGLTNDAVAVVNVLGPLLLGALCVMMYLYARKGLGWSGWKSLLVVVLVSTYFVSLRDSWDLYRQMVGLIFLMAALISLKSFSSPRRYYVASAFMVLTVLSHELAAVILLSVVGLEAVRFLVKKSRKEFAYLAVSAVLPLALFLFQRYSPQQGALTLPSSPIASGSSVGLALYMGGLLVYCYAIILPLVLLGLVGLKDSALRYWALLCLGIPLLEMLNPNLPFYYWNRWVYLLVYPLLFFAVQGLERLWRFSPSFKGNIRRLVPKVLAVAYLFSLLTLSGFYLTTSPENAFPYFYQYNPYLTSIPSSMLQNSISIRDNPSLVSCLEWLNQNTTMNSVIVEHYGLYDLAVIYVRDRVIVPISHDSSTWSNVQNETTLADGMVAAAKEASANGHNTVYTVWWIKGEGWYQIPNLPSDFKEVYRAGKMAVYSYDPKV